MTAVSFGYSLALATYLALFVRVLSRRPLTRLHWSCASVVAAFAVWSIEEVVHGMPAVSSGLAQMFGNIGSLGWGSFASANLVFSMVFTGRDRALRSWWFRALVAVPPVVTVVAQTAVGMSIPQPHGELGWRTVWSDSFWTWFYYAYYSSYTLYSLYVVFRLRRRSRRYHERKQAGLILTAGSITLALGTVADVVLARVPGLALPDLAAAIGLVWAGGLYLAVTRYGLMSITPQAAADDIIRTMDDTLLLLNPDGTVATANRAARGLFGCRIRDLRGMHAHELAADPGAYAAVLAEATRVGSVSGAELDCRALDRRTVPVSVSGRMMRDPDGELVGSVWVLRDITLKRQAEQRQAQMTRAIEAANRELADFAHVVSHDLKAPLRAIDTLAGWLGESCADRLNAEEQEQLGLLVGRVGRMQRLIDGVLEYSRAGQVRERRVQVDLATAVPEVIDLLAPRPDVRIVVETPLPVICAEKTRIEQVFGNLLSNAVKYIDKPDGLVRVGCQADGGHWRFYVADNGPGIEEKDFERIFQVFQTGKPRDQVDSTGVGLAVVKKSVEMYGGRVWVESRVGQGSTFFFTYPKQALEPGPWPAPVPD